jgi:hypothetical protein
MRLWSARRRLSGNALGRAWRAQLVPERQHAIGGHEHAVRQARVEYVSAGVRDVQHQGGLESGSDHRRRIERPPGVFGKARRPRQHRVTHALGDSGDASSQKLADEERVATCLAVEPLGIEIAAAFRHQLTHRAGREPRQEHPAGARNAGQISERYAQGVLRTHFVVAVGHDQERARIGDTSSDEAQQVERSLIGPMRVLDHHQRRARPVPQHVEEGPKHEFRASPRSRRAAIPLDRGSEACRTGARADVV